MRSFDWVRMCAEAFDMEGRLLVLVAGEPPAVAIAPLYRRRCAGGPLELIGARQIYEPADFLYSNPSAIPLLASALVRARLPISFRQVPANSPAWLALQRAFWGRGRFVARPAPGSPWIPLDETWVNPERHLSPRQRSNLRRAQRIAKEYGELQWEILTPDEGSLPSLLDEAWAVEAASWKGGAGTALALDEARGAFFREYAATAAAHKSLRLCFFRIDGQAAAMQIALETGGRFWLLRIGYDPDFAQCSPGTLLLAETIRYAAAAGLRAYEFLGVEESWIRVWTSYVHPCLSVRAYPLGLRGAAALMKDTADTGRAWAHSLLARGA